MPAYPRYSTESSPEHSKHVPNTHTPLNSAYPAESPSFRPHRAPSLASKNLNITFVSIYGRQTRFEQVMQLKTRPATAIKDGAEALLREEKSELVVREEPNRLQKIMALKVPKPTVASTLLNYHPRVVPRQKDKETDKEKENITEEKLWTCQQQCRKQAEAEERAERQWRQQERQRQIQLQRKKKQAEQEEAKQRRKEMQFQKLVEKEVRRIQRERQLSQRKNGGFAIYAYPEC